MEKRLLLAAASPASAPLTPLQSVPVGVLLMGIFSIWVLVLIYYFCKRIRCPILVHGTGQEGSLKDEDEEAQKKRKKDEDENIMLRRFQLEELEKATNNFSQDCLLGSGAFGDVYKGSFGKEGTLAIKRPRAESYQSPEEFRNEVELLSKVKHSNLVGLVGYCEEPGPKGGKLLVYEYVPNGSLLEYITGRRQSLTWRQRVNIAIGTAKGIAYLHDGIKPSIIHRDIKPSNILIGVGFESKVSDFGLVKSGPTGDQSHVSSQIKGTPGYLDPAYCSSFHLTPFSDVYSFGVILLQLLAARPAVYTGRIPSNYHIIEWVRPSIEQGIIGDILDANLLSEPCNMDMMLKMGQLALRCVVKLPKQRPTMTQVWQELEGALFSADNFINLDSSGDFLSSSLKSNDMCRPSTDQKPCRRMSHGCSRSFDSVDAVGLQKFDVEMDSLSFRSPSLRSLEAHRISVDLDNNYLKGIREDIRKKPS